MRSPAIVPLLLALSGVACDGGSATPTSQRTEVPMIEHLANGDLQWDGNAFGLQPRIADPVSAGLVTDTSLSDGDLRRLLRDPHRFAIAHVILTMRSGRVGSFDAEQWNGLRVTLDASGAARYDASDMERLAKQWESK